MECEVSQQHMTDIFGKFANTPSKFQFERGEVSLIKELVAHVKQVVDGNGENSGLHRFKFKQYKKAKVNKARAKKSPIERSVNTTVDTHIDENTATLLRKQLLDKVVFCLKQTGFEMEAEVVNIRIIDVQVEGSQIYGHITCIMCENNANKKSTKRVFYNDSNGCWVISNYQKHLQRVHQLSTGAGTIRSKRNMKPTGRVCDDSSLPRVKMEESSIEMTTEKSHTEIDAMERVCGDSSLPEIKREESLIELFIEKSHTENTHLIEIHSDWLYKQLADQIAKMVTGYLTNGDEMSRMVTDIEGTMINVTVAPVKEDGNCLFAAIAHQLHQHPIDSVEHQEATKLLRAEVVEYILRAENFERFFHTLKDRVYDTKAANEINDITIECKMFVRHVLARGGSRNAWGGFESIKAVSEIHEVNIITFIEEGTCIIHPNKNTMHENTIAIAYRVGYHENSGKEIRNHYDSVIDVGAEDINACIDSLIKRMNKF